LSSILIKRSGNTIRCDFKTGMGVNGRFLLNLIYLYRKISH
jgi:hypothetical protein